MRGEKTERLDEKEKETNRCSYSSCNSLLTTPKSKKRVLSFFITSISQLPSFFPSLSLFLSPTVCYLVHPVSIRSHCFITRDLFPFISASAWTFWTRAQYPELWWRLSRVYQMTRTAVLSTYDVASATPESTTNQNINKMECFTTFVHLIFIVVKISFFPLLSPKCRLLRSCRSLVLVSLETSRYAV